MAQEWPPEGWQNVYEKYSEWGAWYSGDPNQLLKFYSSKAQPFWAKELEEERQTMLHVPVAGDIASTSADLLLSEALELKIPEAHEEEAPQDAKDTQERLNEIKKKTDLYSRMLEAAETASPMSGVFAKVNWNTEFKPFPVLSIAQPDNAIPEFKWGFLQRVTFHKIIEKPNANVYWRHLEIHEPGIIRNQLWKGTRFNLGTQLELGAHKKTRDMEPEIQTGLDEIACVYIPNKKPNRIWRGSSLGQSDIAGIEGLLDSIDETYTNWIRDLRIAKGRIVVPEYMLELDDDGKFSFNIDKEVFTALNQGPPGADNPGEINNIQFDIRSQQHKETATELLEQAYTKAGYSPSSFGMKDDSSGPTTAKEIKSKEGKSFKTRNKKARYFKNGLEKALHLLLKIDAEHFGSNVNTEYRPQVELQDSVKTDPLEKAESIQKLDQAEAMSIYIKVSELHPEWSESQKLKEVERIKQEKGMAVDSPDLRA